MTAVLDYSGDSSRRGGSDWVPRFCSAGSGDDGANDDTSPKERE